MLEIIVHDILVTLGASLSFLAAWGLVPIGSHKEEAARAERMRSLPCEHCGCEGHGKWLTDDGWRCDRCASD